MLKGLLTAERCLSGSDYERTGICYQPITSSA